MRPNDPTTCPPPAPNKRPQKWHQKPQSAPSHCKLISIETRKQGDTRKRGSKVGAALCLQPCCLGSLVCVLVSAWRCMKGIGLVTDGMLDIQPTPVTQLRPYEPSPGAHAASAQRTCLLKSSATLSACRMSAAAASPYPCDETQRSFAVNLQRCLSSVSHHAKLPLHASVNESREVTAHFLHLRAGCFRLGRMHQIAASWPVRYTAIAAVGEAWLPVPQHTASL